MLQKIKSKLELLLLKREPKPLYIATSIKKLNKFHPARLNEILLSKTNPSMSYSRLLTQ